MIKSFLRFFRLRRLLKVEQELESEKSEMEEMKRFSAADKGAGLPSWYITNRIRTAGRIAALECEKKQLEELLGISAPKT